MRLQAISTLPESLLTQLWSGEQDKQKEKQGETQGRKSGSALGHRPEPGYERAGQALDLGDFEAGGSPTFPRAVLTLDSHLHHLLAPHSRALTHGVWGRTWASVKVK